MRSRVSGLGTRPAVAMPCCAVETAIPRVSCWSIPVWSPATRARGGCSTGSGGVLPFRFSNESGKIVAFGARALCDDMPTYLNSPESPHLFQEQRALSNGPREGSAAPARLRDTRRRIHGCDRGGARRHQQRCRKLRHEPRRAADQIARTFHAARHRELRSGPRGSTSATERSLSLLLEQDFEVRVLALPPVGNKKADPDLFIAHAGQPTPSRLLTDAPPYVDYLIARARQMDLTTGEGKQRALNFLLPYIQKIPNGILRSDWATRIAQQLRIDEPLLRSALGKAAKERRSEIKTVLDLLGRAAKPVRTAIDSHAGRGARLSPRALQSICKMPVSITDWRRKKFLRRW